MTCDGISTTAADPSERGVCAYCATPLLAASEVHFPVRRGETEAGHPLIGQVVGGKYRLQGVLGKGGMGTVFRAVHEMSLVPVAIKLLHRRYASRQDYREWFRAEARKAGQVIHEHSARVQDVGETEDGSVFLVMELATGLPLSAWLRDGSTLRAGVVVEILGQIVRALEVAHSVGVVHRDLSPRNIAISIRDQMPFVKILDFGIASGAPDSPFQSDRDGAIVDGGGGGKASPTGYANPAFSAPEHLAGSPDVDGRADLYSVGAIAYQALTGSLPVSGSTPDDVARATREGDLAPFRPPSSAGVSRRLGKLVMGLLSLDPAERPESASAVSRELSRIAHSGQARGLRAAAWIGIFVAALLTVIATLGTREASYLLPESSSALAMFSRSSDVRGQCLRSEELEALQFEFRGFAADDLLLDLVVPVREVGGGTAEGFQGGRVLARHALRPAVPVEGRLVLDSSQPGWSDALVDLAKYSIKGFVDFAFRIDADAPPIGYGRVQIDDQPPVLTLRRLDGGPRDALNGDAQLEAIARDPGTGVRTLTLVLVNKGDEFRHTLDRQPQVLVDRYSRRIGADPVGSKSIAVGVLEQFGSEFLGVSDHGPVDLWVESEDLAGNVGRSPSLHFDHLDLRAPDIRPGTPSVLTFTEDGAVARVDLDVFEPRIAVSVRGPLGERVALQSPELSVLGNRVEFVLAPNAEAVERGEPPFVDGGYVLQIEDAWQNRGRSFAHKWRFVARDPGLRHRLISGAFVGIGEKRFLSDGRGCALDVECSDLYRIRGAAAVPMGAGAEAHPIVVREVVAVGSAGPDLSPQPKAHARLDVPKLPTGSYRLDLDLAPKTGDNVDKGVPQTLGVLVVRTEGPMLELPGLGGAQFFREMLDRSVLSLSEDGTLASGGAWRWSEPHPGPLRGVVWTGPPDGMAPRVLDATAVGSQLAAGGGAVDLSGFVQGIPLLRGANRIALALEDVLGRKLAVWVGGREAQMCDVPDGTRAAVVTDFYHDPAPFRVVEPMIQIEHGQAVSFEVRGVLPAADDDDAIGLQLGRVTLRPHSSRRVGAEDRRYEFLVRFDQIAAAAGLVTSAATEFLESGVFEVPARVQSVAGVFPVQLRFSPTRSSLTPTTLGEIAILAEGVVAERALPDVLSAIRMVPTLGSSMPYRDPTLTREAFYGRLARSRYRALPTQDVRDVREVFLQQAELTRAQYSAIVEGALASVLPSMDTQPGDGWRAFVHRSDPLGSARLSEGGLLPPAAWRRPGADASELRLEWQRAVEAGPSRPVHGLDFFQAHTMTRLLGSLVAGDPDMFRLPMGVELELAALGVGSARDTPRLHGSSTALTPADFAPARGLRESDVDGSNSGRAWLAPTESESRSAGDVVRTELGFEIVGLDYGVREWVLDLPYSRGLVDDALLREWLSDHPRHVQRARGFASHAASDLPDALAAFFSRVGVVRGVALGERAFYARLVEAVPDGRRRRVFANRELDGSIPGVVWCVNIRRDGREPGSGAAMDSSWDPVLKTVGMRLAGGDAFLQRVRKR